MAGATTAATAGEIAALLLANAVALVGLATCGPASQAAPYPLVPIWAVLGLG